MYCPLLFNLFAEYFFDLMIKKYLDRVLQGFPKIKLFEEIGLNDVTHGDDLAQLRQYFLLFGYTALDANQHDIDNISYQQYNKLSKT